MWSWSAHRLSPRTAAPMRYGPRGGVQVSRQTMMRHIGITEALPAKPAYDDALDSLDTLLARYEERLLVLRCAQIAMKRTSYTLLRARGILFHFPSDRLRVFAFSFCSFVRCIVLPPHHFVCFASFAPILL